MNPVETFHWLIALTPVLLMVALFAWLDVFKLMSPWEMIGCLLLGVLAGCRHAKVDPAPGVFFPVFKNPPQSNQVADALSSGVLEERNGCLEVGDSFEAHG